MSMCVQIPEDPLAEAEGVSVGRWVLVSMPRVSPCCQGTICDYPPTHGLPSSSYQRAALPAGNPILAPALRTHEEVRSDADDVV